MIAIGNVRIIQESLTVSAPLAMMWRDKDKILLINGATVKNPHWQLWADSIEVTLHNNRIYSALATGNPRGLWHDPADSLRLTEDSRFSAESMKFTFGEQGVELVELVEQAEVDYYPAPKDSSLIERHIATGDSIAALVVESHIDSIEIYRGVRGTSYQYKPDIKDSLMYRGEKMAITSQKRVHLYQDGWLRYDNMELTAGQIHFDGDTKVLTAKPLVFEDSISGMPFLQDGRDSLRADELKYNVETKRGLLSYGRTAADKGYFTGEKIAKEKEDIFYIQNATFTTCELDTPHYHFFTPQLKLLPKDKAIARSITMYIGKLPTFWLPFFVFSVKTTRHSGILTFDVGKFQRGERFIRNLGYYWAPSDYFDIYAALDIDENTGIYIKGEFRYALRYYFSGGLYSSYKLTSRRDWEEGVSEKKRWELRGNHQQTLGQNAKFSGNLSMVSDVDYLTQTHDDPEKRMERSLRSYASFSQGFSWGNLSLSADRTDDLEADITTTYLPKIAIKKYSGAIFGQGEKWYNKFYYSAGSDMVGYWRVDSTDSMEKHYGADFDFATNFSHSFGDYITLAPALSADGVIQDKGKDGKKFPTFFSYSLKTTASTDLYGNIPLGIFGFRYFHHIISPSVSFSYSPEITGSDNFYSFGGISARGGSESMAMSVNLAQQFGLKKADTSGVLKRIPLFTTNTSFSYNFLADERKLSDITTSINANPADWLTVNVSLNHTPYSGNETIPSGLYLLGANLNSSFHWRWTLPFQQISDTTGNRTERKEFSMNLSHYLSKNLQTGLVTHWIKSNIKTFITPNWRINYSYYYDIEQGKKISDEIQLWRDMHCWELIFVWVPSGIRAGYYVKINVKEIPEIKIERTEGNVRWR